MHRRRQGTDSLLLSALALAIVVGKIVSAGMHEPRGREEFPYIDADTAAAAAENAPAGAQASPGDALAEQPVESGACSEHGEAADD
jgi:hypothetical protein